MPRLHLPQPRLTLGMALSGTAHACIDISDGLLQDLGHILTASRRGADVYTADLPLAQTLSGLSTATRTRVALGGGDVYELCFTAPGPVRARIEAAAARNGQRVTRIGTVQSQPGLRVLDPDGREVDRPPGYDHFA